ncbi:hypothetical protein PPL_07968 [Heterostelium album PN500]|uniref:HIT-type domain-containing protein n=1 Tax=Heterostelium pallidum (strain ATCC 26659 / Pp 5 / PN500) TaxID=670386 RepID=D3BHG6_HETP5|nr:hypothetical protein PPL_07968 [Heterostelium album PN500]EFA79143.1 hypothetical protein PPL_07968 [Heterostelium album PN500]|eukprot:XP_020431265.1 hypothetical protein PPL_07968 [Heterostelium album PN500]
MSHTPKNSGGTTPTQSTAVLSTDYTNTKRKASLSKRFRINNEQDRQTLKERNIQAHLEQLENDNEMPQDQDDDDDYQDDDDDLIYNTPKNKRKINREREKKKSESRILQFQSVLEKAYLETYPSHIPTYLTSQSSPSIYPARSFCSVCGGISSYSCKQCTDRYCSPACFKLHNDNRCKKGLY